MIRRRTAGTVSLVALIAAISVLRAAAPAPPADLDAWVARALQTLEVPGIALAIVKDGTVGTAKGYGVRRLGDTAPITVQ